MTIFFRVKQNGGREHKKYQESSKTACRTAQLFRSILSRYYEHTLYIKQVFRVKYCTGVASIDFFLSF